MEFVIGAASWALDKALASAKDTLAETWAASKGIGDNLDALEMELMHAQWILQDAYVRNSRSKPFAELLVKLRQLAYDADDVLDELDYYRIQDDLDGTHHITDVRDDGGGGLFLNARYTTRAIGKRLTCCSFPPADDDPRIRGSEDPDMPAKRQRVFSCAWPSRVLYQREKAVQTPKLKFDRVDMSTKMKNIVDKLKPICAKLSTIIDTELLGAANLKLEQLSTNQNIGQLGTSRKTTHGNAMKRPLTNADITDPDPILYGRDREIRRIVDGITQGEYCANQLTVLPIVGPGGIGKTTLAQYVYQEVKNHFEISLWICVSINFNGYMLAHELLKNIPEVSGEKVNASDHELIEQRLKNKRFLLILDDVWTWQYDEWDRLFAPFARGGEKGNVVIVTTRFPEVARAIKTVETIELGHLEAEDFMHFFETCIFGDQQPWEGHMELCDVGIKIASKLKGFPLAAKTVGRLLRNQLTLNHWTAVLESKEWESQTDENDIIPALKLSYDYLPFHLQRCFSFLGMFPEDYDFDREELVQLWIRLVAIESCDERKRLEDIALGYLMDLVNYGFLKRNESESDSCYVVHDLLHELAMKVQSKECIRICSSNVVSMQIPPSVRHLSIIVDDTDVKDRASFEQYNKDLSTLDRRLKIQKLRTLMLFGKHNGSFSKTFGNLFREATALRIIFVKGASYSVEDILYNFSRSVHLRYLKFESTMNNEDIHIPRAICRLYHLETIELHGWKVLGSTKTMSNLVKLRHFLLPDNAIAMHSSIFEVGKLKSLQELRRFEVKKESHGFELGQLGHLVELCGSLQIDNLEKVEVKEEADEAKLMQKTRLSKLELRWDIDHSTKDSAQEEQVLESLKPSSNIQQLSIIGHGGATCPSWLRENLSVKYLESLHLDGVAWNIFPPIGELWLVNEPHEEVSSNICGNKFNNLRRLEMAKLQTLKKWAVDPPCELFAHLEVLIIKDCSELTDLSFSHSTCCQQEEAATMNWLPSLRELKIEDCPKLFSFPPVPWTCAPCSVEIRGVGSCFKKLVYERNHHHEYTMEIERTVVSDRAFWNVLAFDNLTELNELKMARCPPLPLHHFQMLSSLKTLELWNSSSLVIPFVEGEGRAKYQFPVECMTIHEWGASAKELTHLLTYFPNLSELTVLGCEKVSGLGAGKEEIAEAATSEGLLLLPPQLQSFAITQCPNLVLCPDSIDSDMDAARIGGGLHGLSSLRSLRITYCPRFLSSYSPSSSSPCFPFPASLEDLSLCDVEGMETLLPLSNLTSITDLCIRECGDIKGEGLWPLLAQGRVTRLTVCGTPNFLAGFEPSPPHEQEFPSSSSKLQKLKTDDVMGILAAPICTLLRSSLTELIFWGDKKVKRFTDEQMEALQLLTSLEMIEFCKCDKLRSLPAELHRLPNLKRLDITNCAAIRSLPKDGLPNSLQELHIHSCPGIRSLPKWDNLPSLLRVLDVHDSESKELRRQCRKLIGTIPIVNA